MSSRVMMIGLDGGSLDFIEASLPSLPSFRRALESGACRRFRSPTTELLPAASWPTLYTGTSPGEHGFYYPMQWDSDAMRLRHVRDWFHCEPFWYELERRGRSVVSLDVPMTWPSRLQRGVEIVDWGAHDQITGFCARPASLAREIQRRFGKYPLGRDIPVAKTQDQLAGMRDALVAGARKKGELARWLIAQHEWDFFIAVFGETHRGGHLFWPTPGAKGRSHPAGALLEVYRAVDDALGGLLEGVDLDDTTLVIVSAHGMGPNASQEHFTREIMDRVNAPFSDTGDGPAPRKPRQRSFMRVLRERLPARLQHAIGQAVPAGVRDFVVDRAIAGGHDWPQTPALAILASVTGFVRFNLRGRESRGSLAPGSEAYGRYVTFMRECFEGFRIAATGERLVKDIVFTGDAFPGKRQSWLPDAIVTWNGVPASRIHSELLGTIEAPPKSGRAGNHRPDGFAIVCGRNGTHAAAKLNDILDIKPMVLEKLAANA